MRLCICLVITIIYSFLPLMSKAQSTSNMAKGKTAYADYNRYVSSSANKAQAYQSALDATEAYMKAIKVLSSDNAEYAECRKALRELFPIMSDAAYFFANVNAQDKVLRFACAHIDISLLSAFAADGLQEYPSYPILANLAATNLFNRGEYEKAIDYYKAYLSTTDLSNRELAFEGLARCFYEKHDYDSAAYFASQGSNFYPTNWNMLLIGIESYGHGGNDDKMAVLLDRALAISPNHKGLLEYQGKLFERQKKFESASLTFERLYSIDNTSLDYTLHYGFNLYNAATEALQKSKAPDTQKDVASELERKANSYFSKAIPLLKNVHDNTPYAANVARALAMCYAITNDNERLQKANETLAALSVGAVNKYEIPTVDLSYKPTVNITASQNNQNDSRPSSDVDINIPVTSRKNDKTYVVVIGNEMYKHHSDVPYAHNDSRVFAEYCQKVLGVPEDNIRKCEDATYSEINEQIKYLQKRCEMSPDELNVIFYYAGHGIPDVSDRSAYLLPADASGTDFESCFSLNRLYDTFDNMHAKNVTVFLDACFSGATRNSEMLFAERFVEFEVEDFVAKGNTVVFSATEGNQTAMGYDEQQHGFFTYYLLKSLQESKGNITLKDLADNIHNNVKAKSFDKKNKAQSPKVTTSPALGDSWQSRTLL